MHPVLVKLGWFNIYSFGFMLAVSFLVGIYVSSYRAKRFGLDPKHVLDLSVILILAGVVGSRLLYVVFHLDEYDSFIDMFALWQGGATLYGGFLLAILATYLYAAKHNVGFLFLADVFAPALALGIMLTRVGCFLSGCCFGKPTGRPWGIVFPPDSAAGAYARQVAAHAGDVAHLHPTQLYASFYGLVIFAVLMLAENRVTKRGAAFGILVAFYGVFRFTLDFFRYYESNMRMLFNLTLNQWISVGMFLVGLYLLLRRTDLKSQRQVAPKSV